MRLTLICRQCRQTKEPWGFERLVAYNQRGRAYTNSTISFQIVLGNNIDYSRKSSSESHHFNDTQWENGEADYAIGHWIEWPWVRTLLMQKLRGNLYVRLQQFEDQEDSTENLDRHIGVFKSAKWFVSCRSSQKMPLLSVWLVSHSFYIGHISF